MKVKDIEEMKTIMQDSYEKIKEQKIELNETRVRLDEQQVELNETRARWFSVTTFDYNRA